ncbi:MAG: outer membrane PBP1 activator LpoA protein [Porticoccus sp.]|jgi:outer membrane PBP1 activator LpoA protein
MFKIQVTAILCFIALLASGCSQISILNIGKKYFPQEMLSHSNEEVSGYSDTQNKIAVLLPLSGAQKKAGDAIQSGFLAALYKAKESKEQVPQVQFYDTESMIDIVALYTQAVNDGAQLVIGPVKKDNTSPFLALKRTPVPIITLNYMGELAASRRRNIFQFGLSATDEGREVANKAWTKNHRSALIIAPDSRWGRRSAKAFHEHWQEKGGKTTDTILYSNTATDFVPEFSSILHIKNSSTRKRNLEKLLGKPLTYTPRRRKDIDMIFLVAYPDHARQIKPTLDFLFAGDIKIYSTSQIYSGSEDVDRNRDLNGVSFITTPWSLDLSTLLSGASMPPIYRHFFALGIDAYKLHYSLKQMKKNPNHKFYGVTGTLQLNSLGAIKRTQPWAKFHKGKTYSIQ